MINWSLILAFLLVVALVSYFRYGAPWLRAKGFDYYSEVNLALMFTGYAFRDEKIKNIAEIALVVVKGLEELSLTATEKHEVAIVELSKELMNEFDLILDDEALDLLVKLAVTILPPTHIQS
ncbi:MAG: hypothetical protein KQ78_01884 [Candidatus Izimaplasma bacterium HR2]|nr:MAG: hypothetical protein KQ78_01884 [Candidatus Izimaplasma bacterium HR2]